MAAFGIEDEIEGLPIEEEADAERFEVWEENRATLEVFLDLATQWNVVATMDGELIRTGIRYETIHALLTMRQDIRRKEWPMVFSDIRSMESAALKTMRELRQRRK